MTVRCCALVALLVATSSALAAADRPPDFGGRVLLDLAADGVPLPGGRAIDVVLEPTRKRDARCGEELLGRLEWSAEDDRAASRGAEARRIAASGGVVARDGDRLTVTPAGAKPLVFADWTLPERRDAEGEERYYFHAGALPGAGYQRVEVHFGHDAPGSYLVPPHGDRVVFVHDAGRATALAPGGARIASFEELNRPHRLVIAALDAGGPRVEVECRFEPGPKQHARTCGWTGATTFETAWDAVPLVFERGDSGWMVRVGAAEAPIGVHCVQP